MNGNRPPGYFDGWKVEKVAIGGTPLLALLSRGWPEVVAMDGSLPADAKIVHGQWEPVPGEVWLYFESDEFAPVSGEVPERTVEFRCHPSGRLRRKAKFNVIDDPAGIPSLWPDDLVAS